MIWYIHILLFLAAISIHEFGHHTFLQFFKIKRRMIMALPFAMGFETEIITNWRRYCIVLIGGLLWSLPLFIASMGEDVFVGIMMAFFAASIDIAQMAAVLIPKNRTFASIKVQTKPISFVRRIGDFHL